MVDKIWYNMEELIGGSEERVLIETYWNVKIHCPHGMRNVSSINRNILECKVLPDIRKLHRGNRINRNILECKVGFSIRIDCSLTRINRNILECKENKSSIGGVIIVVLIETYWNVKSREPSRKL